MARVGRLARLEAEVQLGVSQVLPLEQVTRWLRLEGLAAIPAEGLEVRGMEETAAISPVGLVMFQRRQVAVAVAEPERLPLAVMDQQAQAECLKTVAMVERVGQTERLEAQGLLRRAAAVGLVGHRQIAQAVQEPLERRGS